MNILKSMITAFSMYSKIPMPHIEWDEGAMKYTMCFFPLIGVVIGALVYIIGQLLHLLGAGSVFFAAVMTAIPVLVTGGIHLDGFTDTADALASWGDTQKRLSIMDDPHTGAFAVIAAMVYFVLTVGAWSEVDGGMLFDVCCGFVLSRALSGLAVVTFPKAKKDGLVSSFSRAAHKRRVCISSAVWIAAACALLLRFDIITGAAVICAAGAVYAYHYVNCMKNFGGITGDLAGYFLQLCELSTVLVCAVLSMIK